MTALPGPSSELNTGVDISFSAATRVMGKGVGSSRGDSMSRRVAFSFREWDKFETYVPKEGAKLRTGM